MIGILVGRQPASSPFHTPPVTYRMGCPQCGRVIAVTARPVTCPDGSFPHRCMPCVCSPCPCHMCDQEGAA